MNALLHKARLSGTPVINKANLSETSVTQKAKWNTWHTRSYEGCFSQPLYLILNFSLIKFQLYDAMKVYSFVKIDIFVQQKDVKVSKPWFWFNWRVLFVLPAGSTRTSKTGFKFYIRLFSTVKHTICMSGTRLFFLNWGGGCLNA